ncbi:hypothetical protein EQG64_23195 [Streptomyces sp. S6]|nr:hypothetical protein EQG64_23195 [Streptomyces sp. S6]
MRTRKAVLSAVTGGAMVAGLLMAAAPPAAAASCPAKLTPVIDGASAGWTLRCSGNNLVFEGWVMDTRADGMIVQLRIVPGNGSGTRFVYARGKGHRVPFSYTFKGTKSAVAYLSLAFS